MRYFYTDSVPDVGNALSVWYAANKYMVTALTNACRRILKENINPQNVLQVYQEALTYNELDLIDICWYIISTNIRTVVSSPFFVHIEYETLNKILNNSRMTIPEVKIYEAAVRWASEACKREGLEVIPDNIRGMIGEALYKIRFPVMSNWEFVEGPAQSGILTEKECFEILMFHLAQQKPKQLAFPMFQRQYTGITVNLRSFLSEANAYMNDHINVVRFQSDKSMLLVGVGITVRTPYPFNEIDLRLDTMNSGERYEENFERRSLKPSFKQRRKSPQYAGYSVFLKSPQVIRPNYAYILSTPPNSKDVLRFHPYQTFSQRGVNMLFSNEIRETEPVFNPFLSPEYQIAEEHSYSFNNATDLSYLHFFHKTEA